MSEPNNTLEIWISEKLKECGINARPSLGSGGGNSTELGDIYNSEYLIECKQKRTKLNVIMDYKNEWEKLIKAMPINSTRIPMVVIENKLNEKFVILNAEDFFRELRKLKLEIYKYKTDIEFMKETKNG